MDNSHSKYHSKNAFCGSADPHELEHLNDLISELTDEELKLLIKKVGIEFTVNDKILDREDYEGVIDEAEREDFYREYKLIIQARNK